MIVNKPFFAHAPGDIQFIPLWNKFVEMAHNHIINTKTPKDVTIITYNNNKKARVKPPGLFEQSLKLAGCEYIVLGEEVEKWYNFKKVELLLDYLPKVKTKYILSADSADVIILRNLNSLVESFEKMNCECLFNGEIMFWPFDLNQRIKNFELSINKELYLNSGLYMVRTSYAETLLRKCIDVKLVNYPNSDQAKFKYCYIDLYPKVLVDVNCQLFQPFALKTYNNMKFIKWF